MFDTIRANVNVDIPLESIDQLRKEEKHQLFLKNSNVNEYKRLPYNVTVQESVTIKTGEIYYSIFIRKHRIPFINYYSKSRVLIIEVSIPKYLFGENFTMIKLADLNDFWNKLNADMYDLFGIKIKQGEWNVKRLDCCYNLDVTLSDYTLKDWIQHVSTLSFPYKNNKKLSEDKSIPTGVEYRASSKSSHKIMFYDKQAEILANEKRVEERAKDILRIEIRTSKNERDKYSSSNKLVDYLTLEFYKWIMEKHKINEKLKSINQSKKIDKNNKRKNYEQLIEKYGITQVETLIGHQELINEFGQEIQHLYTESTYKNRKKVERKMMEGLNEPKAKVTKEVFIDYTLFE
ncbi:hypothetical protein [Metabacillus schmidteae]|uniref:hypothetical protein n=1 Tax=Metabacillus schmidteae TaxID=2730405 RepID=UPI00158B72D4|nr:hypothetical protein [Metabacillus schmidteae]